MNPVKMISNIPVDQEPYADYRKILEEEVCYVSQVSVHPGEMVPEHVHMDGIQVYIVSSGCGIVTLDGQDYQVEAGMSVVIPRGVRHSARNIGDSQLIYVFMEAFYQEDSEKIS